MCGVASTASHPNSGKPAGRRLGREHVQRGAGHLAGLNGLVQRGFVHQLAARAVHDPHARLHGVEGRAREHALRLRRGGHVQRDVIAARRRARPDPPAPRRGPARSCEVTYGSCATMRISKARARFTTSRPMLPRPMMPSVLPRSSLPMSFFFSHLPAARGSVGLRDAARHGQHQRQGVLGHRDGVAAGRVHHQHAGRGGGVQIHVVHAHAGAADHAQFRGLFEHGRRNLHGAAHQQARPLPPGAGRIPWDWRRSRSSRAAT